MKIVYEYCGISRQAHTQALARERLLADKRLLYIHLMYEIRKLHPGMGLRKMYEQFRPDGIGRDAFISLGLVEGLRLRSIPNPTRTTWRSQRYAYPNLLVGKRFTGVNQIWSSDITYFSLGKTHYYIVLIMDVYSRKIVGYSVADNMKATNNIAALEKALNLRGISHYNKGLIHHSDRGTQYTSEIYINRLEEFGICVSMCREVLENSHIERANGTIKNEYLYRWEIQNFSQLKKRVTQAVENYNNRLHQSLKGKTPNEYETHIRGISNKEREPMTIFTYSEVSQNSPIQLDLFQS